MLKKGVKREVISLKANSFEYDDYLDILDVRINGKTHHCINFDDLIIIGLTNKNKIASLEFLNISRIAGIPQKFLRNITSSNMIFNSESKEKKMFISLNLKSKLNAHEVIQERMILPPMNTQFNNSIISI